MKQILIARHMKTTPARLDEVLDEWMGTPYRHYASVKGRGTDCIGMVLGVLTDLGFFKEQPDLPFYTMDWWLSESEHQAFDTLKQLPGVKAIRPEQARVGDVVCMRFGRADEAHVGMVNGTGKLVHSLNPHGVIKSNLREPYHGTSWGDRTTVGYRVFTLAQMRDCGCKGGK